MKKLIEDCEGNKKNSDIDVGNDETSQFTDEELN
jgi:hypothetical protein